LQALCNNVPFGTNEFSKAKENKLLDAYLVYNKTFDKLVLMLQQDIHIKMGSYNYVKKYK
jgi:hypothetical protein